MYGHVVGRIQMGTTSDPSYLFRHENTSHAVSLSEVTFLLLDEHESDEHAFPNEDDACRSLCFGRELGLLEKYKPDPSVLTRVRYVIRAAVAADASRLSYPTRVALQLCAIVFLSDANLAMRRFQMGQYKASATRGGEVYSGLFMEGLCRIHPTQGFGRHLVNLSIRISQVLQKKLYLSVFKGSASSEDVHVSHGKLIQYYNSLGFVFKAEYCHPQALLTYTIMEFVQ